MLIGKVIQKLLRKVGFELIRTSTFEHFKTIETKVTEWNYWGNYHNRFASELSELCHGVDVPPKFNSQIGQDYVAYLLFGTSGYFVEFGAADGIFCSNSYALETIGWMGILAEPSVRWHSELFANRPKAEVHKECVWSTSGEEIQLVETENGYLDVVESHIDADAHRRKVRKQYLVQTISLFDLLQKCKAPEFIQFLSIDTEGSEYEILSAFNWSAYTFGFIAVEHNFTPMRSKIFELLNGQGYRRILADWSKHDDWYVHKSLTHFQS